MSEAEPKKKESKYVRMQLLPEVGSGVSPGSLRHATPVVPSSNEESIQWAVTVNLCPDKYVNRRRWRDLTDHEQMSELMSQHQKYANEAFLNTISIKKTHSGVSPMIVDELNFETCPKSGQKHFHALITAQQTVMESYKKLWTGNLKNWRTIDSQEVKCYTAWLAYIRKDVDNGILTELEELYA